MKNALSAVCVTLKATMTHGSHTLVLQIYRAIDDDDFYKRT